uniref:Putative ovule protein n=1 Tax=Solanum chacoense TaxID=4108 RepID=A0A0V0GW23_SOLCH
MPHLRDYTGMLTCCSCCKIRMNHVAVLAVHNYNQIYQHHYKQYKHNNSDQKPNLLNFHQLTELNSSTLSKFSIKFNLKCMI